MISDIIAAVVAIAAALAGAYAGSLWGKRRGRKEAEKDAEHADAENALDIRKRADRADDRLREWEGHGFRD
jgi:hypothetical protein